MTVSEPVSKSYIAAARYDFGTNRECSHPNNRSNRVSEKCEVPAYLMQPAKIEVMSVQCKKTGTIAKFMSDVYTVSRHTGPAMRNYPETA